MTLTQPQPSLFLTEPVPNPFLTEPVWEPASSPSGTGGGGQKKDLMPRVGSISHFVSTTSVGPGGG